MAVQLRTLKATIEPDLSKIAPGLAQADGLFDAFAKRTRAAPAVPIAPPDPRVASALETIATKANTAVGASDKVARSLSTVGVQATKSERELLQYASSIARGQQATGNYAGATNTLTTALAQVDSRSVQAVRATNQLNQAEAAAEKQSHALGGALRTLQQAFGVLGVAVGLQQLLAFGGDAVRAANELDKTEATVQALSGSQERYNEVLKLAEAGQRKYGGSLNENLSGLGSLVNLSNRTSVELTQLDAVARRLAIVDPLQGISGATVALKEFLTGSDATAIQSLVKRFELPKAALKELTDESISTQEKLQRLDEILADQGISMEVLENRTNTTAATYDRLGSAADNAKVAIGKLIAEKAETWAERFAQALQGAADGANSLAKVGEKQAELNARVLTGSKTYDEYAKRVAVVNEDITSQTTLTEGMVARLPVLTEQQFKLVRAMEAQGIESQQAAAGVTRYSAELEGLSEPQQALLRDLVNQGRGFDDAISTTQGLGRALSAIGAVERDLVSSGQESGESAAQLTQRLTALAQINGPVGASAIAVANAYRLGATDADGLTRAIGQLEIAQRSNENAATISALEDQRLARGKQDVIAATKLEGDELEKLQQKLETTSERGAEATERLREAQIRFADDTADRREQLVRRLADAEQEGASRLADLTQQSAEQRQHIEADFGEQRAAAEQDGASRLADLAQQAAERRTQLEQDFGERRADVARAIATQITRIDEDLAETQASIVEQRTERLTDIQARLVDAQEGLNQELARQQQSYEDRLSDLQTRSSDSRIDRQADQQQKLADLQAQLGQATDAEEQQRIQRQIDRANQDAAEKEARATRDEARALEKLEREKQRDEARAREKAAQQEAELTAQIAKEEAASAAKLAKAEQDAAADRQRSQAAAQAKLAELDTQQAAEAAKLNAKTAAEREQIAAAAQARLAELDTQQAEELAKLDAKAASERQKIAAAQAEQLDDLRAGFAADEQERAKAFARQETQLTEALGKQLAAYVDYQEQLGLIDAKTAQAKRTALAERFGVGEQQNANEFGALASGLGTDGNVALAQRSLGLLGGLGNLPGLGALTSTVNAITVPQIIIQGVSDPEATARMVRDELERVNRQNGSTGIGSVL